MDIALVGLGWIAREQHVPTIAASPDWDLKATVSRSNGLPGMPHYTDFKAFLEARGNVAAVSLCMPAAPRFAYAAAALKAGLHVMLEKPPGASLSECETLVKMADDAGVCLFFTWHSRQAEMVEPAANWLAGKRLRRLCVTWKEDVRRWHPGQDWIWEPGGLGVFDPGINALSIVTQILPERLHLTEATLDVPGNKQGPIGAKLRFAHPQGADVTAEFDWCQTGEQIWRIEAETDHGTMRLEEGGGRMFIDDVPQNQGPGEALGGEYPRLYARMAELVRSGRSDTDLEPLRHVADAFMLGRRRIVDPFVE